MKEEFDITKHILVPKHILLSKDEAKKFLEKHNLTITQLPKILKKDPIIVNLDPSVGDIIKIIRKSPTANETAYYRVIIDE